MGITMRGRELTEFWKQVMAPHPAEEKVISRCEAKVAARFPEEFRERMMKTNGGLVRTGSFYWFVFPCPDRSHVMAKGSSLLLAHFGAP